MARKIILDMDPGVDDAMALCMALTDSRLDVVAVTATGGNVQPEQATRNVQAVIEQVDPARWPRIGAASPTQYLRTDARHLHGVNGLSGAHFHVAELHHRHRSAKVISDEVRAAPGEVTIVCTGPLSNLAEVFQREPDLASMVGHLIILGGTLDGPGNVTPAAEFNIYCDAAAARAVFRCPVTKTVIPIDVTQRIMLNYDHLSTLQEATSRTADLLRMILPGAFRAYRQQMGVEGMFINDVLAIVAAMHPELFTTEPMHGDVETEGELTHGATIFDRRQLPDLQPNMDVAVDVDVAGATDCILRGLAKAG